MRRVSADGHDIFRPTGQLRREIELAGRRPRRVVEILREHLSSERADRIDATVSHRTRSLTVAIEGVRDPHNTAAVIRTADAYGLQEVHVVERGVRFLSSRRVTQGAHKWVDLGVWSGAESFTDQMRRQKKRILVASVDGATPIADLVGESGLALVFGNEHEGVSAEMRALADGAFAIPMYGFVESFNVSVAAALSISRLRRDGRGDLGDVEAAVLRARFYLRAVRAGYDIVTRKLGEDRG
jgi:tRNA (guanosine-2'-O-)-methyltransferase